jgi:hypothetical protein
MGASIALGSLGGFVGGYLWAGKTAMTPGQARMLGVGGDVGILWGFGAGHLLGLDDDERPLDAQARGMATAGLLGAVGGLAASRWEGKRGDYTWGDGEVVRAGGLLGTWCGATAALVLDVEGSKGIVSSLMTGSALGLGAGLYLVDGRSFSVGEAIVTDLSMLAGGLGAAGLLYLIAEADEPKPYFIAAAAGGALGYAFGFLAHDATVGERAGRAPAVSVGLAPRLGPAGERGVGVVGRF